MCQVKVCWLYHSINININIYIYIYIYTCTYSIQLNYRVILLNMTTIQNLVLILYNLFSKPNNNLSDSYYNKFGLIFNFGSNINLFGMLNIKDKKPIIESQ